MVFSLTPYRIASFAAEECTSDGVLAWNMLRTWTTESLARGFTAEIVAEIVAIANYTNPGHVGPTN